MTVQLTEITHLRVTDNIVLTPVEDADAPALFDLIDSNRAHLRKWLPWLDFNTTIEDSHAFVRRARTQASEGIGLVMTIRHDEALCGIIGFNSIDALHRICEIGYWLDADAQGNGIMTRSTRRMIDFAFEDLAMNKVSIPVAEGNAASRAIPERLGLQVEGVSRDAEWLYDHFVSHVLYAGLRSDWPT